MNAKLEERDSSTATLVGLAGGLAGFPADTGQGREGDLDSSVGKALALLGAFAPDRRTMGVSELARQAGLPKSTAFRLLAILLRCGLVERCGTTYSLGTRLVELANLVSHSPHQNLRDVALPYLQDLYEQTHETIHLAVLDGLDVLYVEKLYGHDSVRAPSQVGGRMPATATALGKAMLAFSDPTLVRQAVSQDLRARTPYTIVVPATLLAQLHAVRSCGVAFDREEAALGLTCVASPVLDASGRAVAAVSVSGATRRFVVRDAAFVVRKTAQELAKALRQSR